jgi:hypothetical protein
LSFSYRNYFKQYPWRRVLASIKQRCYNPKARGFKDYGGKGIICTLTDWEIQYIWFRDGADKMKKPSIDRFKTSDNYSLGNCQFIEFGKNIAKRNQEVSSKRVKQCLLDGYIIKIWPSVSDAAKYIGCSKSAISNCALGKVKTSAGFIWRY